MFYLCIGPNSPVFTSVLHIVDFLQKSLIIKNKQVGGIKTIWDSFLNYKNIVEKPLIV